jgi:hypothetical protein
MKYTANITILDDEGNLMFERELTSDELVEALLDKKPNEVVSGPEVEPEKLRELIGGKRKYKKRTPKPDVPTATESASSGRKRLDPELREKICQDLLAEVPITRICEKYDVSRPTAYVIKTKMEQEGRFDKKPKPSLEEQIRPMLKKGLSVDEITLAIDAPQRKIEEAIAHIEHGPK